MIRIGRLKQAVFVLVAVCAPLLPMSALADTLSITQTITVRATVLPARSIVVNDAGQMIKIYSNTNEAITPKVYLNHAPGAQAAMTPALQQQYDAIITSKKNLEGVAIDVPIPASSPLDSRLGNLLANTVRAGTRQLLFNW